MPTKTTKKATVKTTTVKKPVAKKAATKKVVKTSTKPAATKAPKATAMVAPAAHECHCGPNCQCVSACKCSGRKFARIIKKLIIALILLAIGFVAGSQLAGHRGPRGPRIEFAPNGCMIEESVKCPKLIEALPAMDINQDGCITREEFRAVKQQMRREVREMQVDVAE
ncbi:MAG: hypothetical protein NC311_01780 [Muribaculaceae bacterium]|nr:hypothetical protein [Muribaculaceae bacterium]